MSETQPASADVSPSPGATGAGQSPGPGEPRPPGRQGGSGRRRTAAAARPRRRRNRWRAAFFVLAGAAIVLGVAWALLGDRVLVVRSVTVTGTRSLAPAQVIAAAGVPLGTPLLSVDTGAVTRRVEAINQVASATVAKDWPDHLAIVITERVPVLAVRMASGGYDLVDPSGVIVRMVNERPAALPVLVTALPGSALRGDPGVVAAGDVLAELQPSVARQAARVTVATVPAGPPQVTLALRDGKTIVWGSAGNAGQKNRELSLLLPGQARYLDVSAPGAVVTR